MRVSIVGLGKLGSPLAAVLASKGHYVICVDVNPEAIRRIQNGRAPVEEPRLQELIDLSRKRLSSTSEYEKAILETALTFIVVPTPSDENGAFSNRHVLASLRQIGSALKRKEGYHLVNITSTVMPGSTGGELRQTLELHSGRRVGQGVGLCYNPEFVSLGSVVEGLLTPDFVLIGESDTRAGDVLASLYATVCENDPPIRRMNFANAELVKLSVNTFVTTKISYANMLADICDRLPDTDVDVVTKAVGCDSRIGEKYLKGATGYGGPCFPRDNLAFAFLARSLGARADIAEATDSLNRYQKQRLFSLVRRQIPSGGTVGILGVSYKPDTGVIEESQGVALAQLCLAEGFRVVVYDPMGLEAARILFGDRVSIARSGDACVRAVDILVITIPWPEFRELPVSSFSRVKGRITVIDCWRILPVERFSTVADIVYLGHHNGGVDQVAILEGEARS